MSVLDLLFIAATALTLVLRGVGMKTLPGIGWWTGVPLLLVSAAVSTQTFVADVLAGRYMSWPLADVPLGVQVGLFTGLVMLGNDILDDQSLLQSEGTYVGLGAAAILGGIAQVVGALFLGYGQLQYVTGAALVLAGSIFFAVARLGAVREAYRVGAVVLAVVVLVYFVAAAQVGRGSVDLGTLTWSVQEHAAVAWLLLWFMALGGARQSVLSASELGSLGKLIAALVVFSFLVRHPDLKDSVAALQGAQDAVEWVGTGGLLAYLLIRVTFGRRRVTQ